MKLTSIRHEFVEFVPAQLEEGMIYISLDYATASHLCACGCGSRVVTKLAPDEWRIIFDGKTVSLWPSIGNWSFGCQSHYWIKRDKIEWSRQWSAAEVDRVRRRTRGHGTFAPIDPFDASPSTRENDFAPNHAPRPSMLSRLRRAIHL